MSTSISKSTSRPFKAPPHFGNISAPGPVEEFDSGPTTPSPLPNHFNYWKSHIGSMGTFQEMKLNVEAWGGRSGMVNATVW